MTHGTAEESWPKRPHPTPDVDAVWLDPARRTAGHSETSRTRPEDWSPPLDWVFALAASACRPASSSGPGLDRAMIPDDVEAQWVSADGSTVELVLWSGALAREGVRRAALVMRGDAAWELTSAADAADEPVRPLGAFLHEPDGAVIRARLIGDVARSLEAGMLDEQIAYLTSDAALTSPFVASLPRARGAARRADGARHGAAGARHRPARDQEARRRRRPGRVPHGSEAARRRVGDAVPHAPRARSASRSSRTASRRERSGGILARRRARVRRVTRDRDCTRVVS